MRGISDNKNRSNTQVDNDGQKESLEVKDKDNLLIQECQGIKQHTKV